MSACDPRVTVILPTFNRAREFPETLHSLLAQTFTDWELVLVDDGSTDDTPRVFECLCMDDPVLGSKAQFVRFETNRGANAARNAGINVARGQLVAFLDSDDFWNPDKLAYQVAAIDAAGSLDGGRNGDRRPFVLSYTGRVRVGHDNRVLARQYPGSERRVRRILSRANVIGPLSSVVVSRSAAVDVGGFDESLPSCQDWDFYLRVLPICQLVGIDLPLLRYFDGSFDRISTDPRKRIRGHAAIYRRYIEGHVDRRAQRAFWTNIAEDLEALGHCGWARRFMSYQQLLAGEWTGAIRTFWGRGPLELRRARYQRYEAKAAPRQPADRYARSASGE